MGNERIGARTLASTAQDDSAAIEPAVGKRTLVEASYGGGTLGGPNLDGELVLATLPLPGGKATIALKLDAKASAKGKLSSKLGAVTLFDLKASRDMTEQVNAAKATIGKIESFNADLSPLFPGYQLRVEGSLAKVTNAKVEGPSIAIVLWKEISDQLPPEQRERGKLTFEIKIEIRLPSTAALEMIERAAELRRDAEAARALADETRRAEEIARKEYNAAKQAVYRARQLKDEVKSASRLTAALQRFERAKQALAPLRERAAQAFRKIEELGVKLIEVGEKLRARGAVLSLIERKLVELSERQLVRVLGKTLGYVIPVVDVVLLAYDVLSLGMLIRDYARGRARFALGGDAWSWGAEGGIWVDGPGYQGGGSGDGDFIGPDPNPKTTGKGTMRREGDATTPLHPMAFWAAGLIDREGGTEFNPTPEQWNRLNEVVPKDLLPAEQAEIARRFTAESRTISDWEAGMRVLAKIVTEVRAGSRAKISNDQIDASTTNPGAQRVAAMLGGDGILSNAEYDLLCQIIPVDVTRAELDRLAPYLTRKGQKADVRWIGEWIRQLRAGETLTIPSPGLGADPTSTATTQGLGAGNGDQLEGSDGNRLPSIGLGDDVDGASTSRGLGTGDGTTPSTATQPQPVESSGGGGGDQTRRKKTRGGTETTGVLTAPGAPTERQTKVVYEFRATNAKVGSRIAMVIAIPALRIRRTITAVVTARSGSSITVELLLGSLRTLRRDTRGDGVTFSRTITLDL